MSVNVSWMAPSSGPKNGLLLRRYKRRWKIEPGAPRAGFAWLDDFRRLVVRYERHVENYRGFMHLGCILILLRQDL
jgi:transposase